MEGGGSLCYMRHLAEVPPFSDLVKVSPGGTPVAVPLQKPLTGAVHRAGPFHTCLCLISKVPRHGHIKPSESERVNENGHGGNPALNSPKSSVRKGSSQSLDGESYRLRDHYAAAETLRRVTTGTRQPLH